MAARTSLREVAEHSNLEFTRPNLGNDDGVLASLLPGLRQTRTPFIVGAAYLLCAWLMIGPAYLVPSVSSDNLISRRLAQLVDALGTGPTLAAVGLLAYLVGSLLTRTPTLDFGRLRAQDTWGSYERWAYDLHKDSEAVETLLSWPILEETSGPPPYPVPGILESKSSVDEVIDAALWDYTGIVASLQVDAPEQYGEYDRICAEAELRYSLVIPMYLLVGFTSVMVAPACIVGVLMPIALNRHGKRLEREAVEFVLRLMVNDKIESPYTAALRQFKAEVNEKLRDGDLDGSLLRAEQADETDRPRYESDWQWDNEPRWWFRTRFWLARAIWPGGQFSWRATPWDQEARSRTLRGSVKTFLRRIRLATLSDRRTKGGRSTSGSV